MCLQKNIKIAHLTSAHPRYDTRIFAKEAVALANCGYEVSLIVADGQGDEFKNKVYIYDVGRCGGRLCRITKSVRAVFKKGLELDCDIYHLHDPELLPIGLKLKKFGKKVIFDAHEDLPIQILSKPYLNKPILRALSFLVTGYQNYVCSRFDAVICATDFIKDKFLKVNPNSFTVKNYPIIGEFKNSCNWDRKQNEVCYIGSISEVRGIKEIVKALEFLPNVRLNLAGKFNDKELEKEVKSYKGWQQVNELGFLNRQEIAKVLERSKIGLVTLHPIPNYIDALPTKMFEYMLACIPVISSDIKLWKDIINSAKCGVAVNPKEPKEIAKAIEHILENEESAKKMGENGKKAVLERYNWEAEEKKLIEIYKKL